MKVADIINSPVAAVNAAVCSVTDPRSYEAVALVIRSLMWAEKPLAGMDGMDVKSRLVVLTFGVESKNPSKTGWDKVCARAGYAPMGYKEVIALLVQAGLAEMLQGGPRQCAWVRGRIEDAYWHLASRYIRVNPKAADVVARLESVEFTYNKRMTAIAEDAFRRGILKDLDKVNEQGKLVKGGAKIKRLTQAVNSSFRGEIVRFAWKADHRVRVYQHGRAGTPMGDKHDRACVDFARVSSGVEGRSAILRALGEAVGCKARREEREAAGERFYADKSVDLTVLFAENPMAARYWVALDELEETGKTYCIVYQDATNSGIQIYGMILRSPWLCELTNLTSKGFRDIAAAVAKELGISRKSAKALLTPRMYGLGETALAEHIAELAEMEGKSEEDRGWFFVKYMEVEAEYIGNALGFGRYLRNMVYNGDWERTIEWMLPDGVICRQLERDWDNHELRVGELHCYLDGVPGISRSKQASAIAANVIHSIDAYILRLFVRMFRGEMMTIHDSFGVTPSQVDEANLTLRRAYARAAMELNANSVTQRVFGTNPQMPLGEWHPKEMGNAVDCFI